MHIVITAIKYTVNERKLEFLENYFYLEKQYT